MVSVSSLQSLSGKIFGDSEFNFLGLFWVYLGTFWAEIDFNRLVKVKVGSHSRFWQYLFRKFIGGTAIILTVYD